MKQMLQAAIDYHKAGLSVVPTNSHKIPTVPKWTPFQKEPANEATIRRMFANGESVALIGGAVSGNLEILDFDCSGEAVGAWGELVKAEDSDLANLLPYETTPSGGGHIVFRCPDATIPGAMRLAQKKVNVSGPGKHVYANKEHEAKQINGRWYIAPCLIETRGEGHYAIVNPSPGYVLKKGDFRKPPVVTAEQRDILINAARALNEWSALPEPAKPQRTPQPQGSSDLSPGDDYSNRADIRALLERHGWVKVNDGSFKGSKTERYRRPGKSHGWSASLIDGKIFHNFSGNADPFEMDKAYAPFSVYGLLEHGGDFKEAAKVLAGKGYGTKVTPQKEPNPSVSNTGNRGQEAAPTMADLREYIDLCVVPGQKFTTDEICRGLSCFKREHKKCVYTYLGRLVNDGIIRKDEYKYGGYRRVVELGAIDLLANPEDEAVFSGLSLPLDLDSFLSIRPNQLLQVSGRYDAGKSTFLFQILAENYENHKVVHIVSEEWSTAAIVGRLDALGVDRKHPNLKTYRMQPGFEDTIPPGPCIVLVDYLRADENPYQTDAQIQQILKRLDGGVAIFATQKHPGLDKPVGGQFAVHASHHIVMLDRWKSMYTCKIYRSKSTRNLEGIYRPFSISADFRIHPNMDNWKAGDIKWDRDQKKQTKPNDDNDNNDNKNGVVNRGGPCRDKERKKERKEPKERKKERKSPPTPQPSTDAEDFVTCEI